MGYASCRAYASCQAYASCAYSSSDTGSSHSALEPSAGKGDIVDWLLAHGAKEVIACEKDPNLRQILGGKCPVIADDFLTVTSEQVSHVDMIVMNPPFQYDMKHILHAYAIAPAGCTVIALCNASHIERGYNSCREREFRELIETSGWSEDIGEAFSRAERPTDVSTGLVKLYKPGSGASEFDGYVFDGMPDTQIYGAAAGIITYDFVRDIVNRYVAAVSAFDEVKAKADEINRLAQFPDAGPYNVPPIRFMAVEETRDGRPNTNEVSHARYRKELQKYYWRVIFEKMNLQKYATRQLREQINRFVERNANTPFTMRNIYNVLAIVFQTNGKRMESALNEAFDTICSFSDENSTAGEKWKTNSDYVVNRKFIVPWITEGYRWNNEPERYVRTKWSGNSELIDDIVRALCYFTGTPLYPFGYGLTYGDCKAQIAGTEILKSSEGEKAETGQGAFGSADPGQSAVGSDFAGVRISITAQNEGRETDDVLQIYVKDLESPCAVPGPQLAGFRRIHLGGGEERTYEIDLPARAFTSVDEAGIRAIRGKRFCIYAGFQQPGARSEELTGASCAAVEIEV